jgi:hypothetical protein
MQSQAAAGKRRPRSTHQSGTVSGLLLLEMDNHPMQVVIEPGCQLFAHAPDFLKELVLHDAGSTSEQAGFKKCTLH